MRFSVIIVSWNALDLLKKFLPSVVSTDYSDFEIILADNASTDGSAEWVSNNYSGVKVVRLDRNYGYCGGNNRGARHADGDILVFLNNDVEVDPLWLNALRNCFEMDANIAAAQPKMLSYNHPDYFEYAGAAGGFLDKYGYPYCRGRLFETIEKDEDQYNSSDDIFWASGAALAIRRERFEWLGGFDEDFQFHMEEIDLCWKLHNKGYRVVYCPLSTVYHVGGGSLPKESPRKTYYNFRNNLILLWKNLSRKTLGKRFTVRLLLDGITLFYFLFTLRIKELGALLKAYFSFLGMFRQTNAKRKQLLASRQQEENPSVMSSYSIVWKYYVRGKRYFKNL